MKLKKLFYLLLPVVLLFSLGLSWRGTSGSWKTLRAVSATEDTNLTASTQYISTSESAGGLVVINNPTGAVCLVFKGTAAADKTLSWFLWARLNLTSPAEYVAHGTAQTGATITGSTNEYYCDTITIIDQQWYSELTTIDDAPDAVISDGGISKLFIPNAAERTVWEIKIRDIGGGGSECATAGVMISNFETR